MVGRTSSGIFLKLGRSLQQATCFNQQDDFICGLRPASTLPTSILSAHFEILGTNHYINGHVLTTSHIPQEQTGILPVIDIVYPALHRHANEPVLIPSETVCRGELRAKKLLVSAAVQGSFVPKTACLRGCAS